MNVYIGTSGELKNAYIGEYHTLKYDFTTQNVLTFKYQGDNTFPYGWTSGSGYYTFKTSYYQGVTSRSLPNSAYISNVKKITIKYHIDNSICGFAVRDSSGQTRIRHWQTGTNPPAIQSYLNGVLDLNQQYTAPAGDAELVLDFENGKLTYGTGTATLSSSFISAFRTEWANGTMYIGIANGNNNVGSNEYYTYMKNITIEY